MSRLQTPVAVTVAMLCLLVLDTPWGIPDEGNARMLRVIPASWGAIPAIMPGPLDTT